MADNKDVVRGAVNEVWNKGDLNAVEKYYADDYTFYTEGGGVQRGPASMREWAQTIHGAFPDINYNLDALYAEGDKVAARYSVTGTHTGDFRGLPPTNKPIKLTGHMILYVRDGKIVQGHGYWDTLGLLQQLGLTPPLGPPRA
jgi:steroid delta-isomerase-like uncharacterized protein